MAQLIALLCYPVALLCSKQLAVHKKKSQEAKYHRYGLFPIKSVILGLFLLGVVIYGGHYLLRLPSVRATTGIGVSILLDIGASTWLTADRLILDRNRWRRVDLRKENDEDCYQNKANRQCAVADQSSTPRSAQTAAARGRT